MDKEEAGRELEEREGWEGRRKRGDGGKGMKWGGEKRGRKDDVREKYGRKIRVCNEEN